jgi:hypothetical protein
MKRAFEEISLDERRQLEELLKRIARRAEELGEREHRR